MYPQTSVSHTRYHFLNSPPPAPLPPPKTTMNPYNYCLASHHDCLHCTPTEKTHHLFSEIALNSLLQLLKKQVAENSRHLNQYFQVFLNYANRGVAEVRDVICGLLYIVSGVIIESLTYLCVYIYICTCKWLLHF